MKNEQMLNFAAKNSKKSAAGAVEYADCASLEG